MHLIVGLGNPGDKHKSQRHNIGFMAVDAIAARHNFPAFREKFSGLLSEGTIDGEKVLILKPQTFMNRSGDSVEAVAQFYKIAPADITVIYDELDLVPGKVRVKLGGGNGGHNGLRSIDPKIGTGYHRIRLGIGHPGHKDRVTGYVLGEFTKADREWLDPLFDTLGQYAGLIVKGEENTLMNRLTLATAGDKAERPERPARPDGKSATKPAQSHIRAARSTTPQVEVPKSGPMAAMLAKVFGKKPQ